MPQYTIQVDHYSKFLGDGGPGVSRETTCLREMRLVHVRKLLGVSRTETKETMVNEKKPKQKTTTLESWFIQNRWENYTLQVVVSH